MAEKKTPFDQQKSDKLDIKDNSKPGKKRKKRSLLKIVLLVVLILAIAVGGALAAVAYSYIEEAPTIDHERLATVETSYLYDSNGNEITALHEEQNRIVVELNEIPNHVQQAFIAIEDERFYSHFGFDIIGSFRAFFVNLRAGTIVQGASTLTQQLAQNAFLTTETSYKRKVQEIWLALQLERSYSKEEIIEFYLNRMYFGNGAYGVEAAAQTYFNKNVDDLTIAEGAMLAAALRSPNYYNPIDNQAAAEERMELVLFNMNRLELINGDEYRQALNQNIVYSKAPSEEYPYPHFVDYVVHHDLIRILSALPSIGSVEEAYRAIYTGGLRVYTTLEPPMQSHVEEVLGRTDLYPTTILVNMPRVREAVAQLPADIDLTRAQIEELVDEANGVPQPQAAIVVADPTTGQIKALGGGREYRKKVDEVLRFNTLRQPGSAIKPIITYGPAFEEGVLAGAASTVDDAPYINPAGNWFPENFDFRFRGMVTAREALYMSYNIPAIRTIEALGPRVGAAYAERMGISTLHPDEVENLSLTLGGLTYGVSAIDMAQAYGVLANNGVRIDLHAIESIVDRSGEVIYENSINPQQILSPQTAFIVNDILQDFVTQYLGRALQIDRPVAAKTGTTENWNDVYLVAYTPNLVASFWMGYDEPKMGSIEQGWRYSTAFLREVFLEAFENLEIKEFERPEGIVSVSVCNKSGLLPNESCRAAGTVVSDYFIAANAPGESCDMHNGMFYDRPPFITTDGRWSSRGGPGRGPEDAKNMRPGELFDMQNQFGRTTNEIGLFNALVTPTGVILQWLYDGPDVFGFILSKSGHGGGGGISVILSPSARQYTDTEAEAGSFLSYTIAAMYPDGTMSESATVIVNNSTAPGDGGGEVLQPEDRTPVIVPDLVGTFQAVAEMQISRLGLILGTITEVYDPDQPRRIVLSQSIPSGASMPKGTVINLVVSIK